jgi:RNA polymerase nonessential primary-like sigma factor
MAISLHPDLKLFLEVQQMIAKQSTDTKDFVRMYLREIGKVPLLTRQQEIDYGTQVQQMMSLLEAKETLAKKLRREPTSQEWASQVHLSESELKETDERAQRAKQKMISANLRLVVVIAKKYQNRNMEFLDLIQEGALGLSRAVEKFDPARGWKFSTYAYWWVFQAITRGISEKSRTIRLPIHIIEKLNKIKKVQRQLSQQLGRTPTTAEVATKTGLTPKQVREYLERARLPLSLEMRVGDNQDTELGELLEDTGITPEEFVMQSSVSDELERLMADLTTQQREVLELRFGLVNGQALSLIQIGSRLGISRERVRQIERKALDLLRRRKRVCQEYLSSLVQK